MSSEEPVPFVEPQPSTCGFITLAGTTFGGTSAVSTALTAGVGYITAMSAGVTRNGTGRLGSSAT